MSNLNTVKATSTVNRTALVASIFLVIALWLLHSQQLSGVTQWFSQEQLYQQNQQYLEHTRAQAQQDFSRLAALTGLLEVAQSSQIGVSFIADFNVDVGNALAALTRLLERGSEVAMASAATLMVLSLVSDTADAISPAILQVTLIVALVWQLMRLFGGAEQHQIPVREATGLLFSVYLVLHLALPYSLHLAQGISHNVSADLRQTNRQSLSDMHLQLFDKSGGKDLKHSAENSVDKLKKLSSDHINHKVSNLSSYVINTLTLALFDLVLLPGVLLFMLYRAVLLLSRHTVSLVDDKASSR